jgi:hypothetical protein
VIAKDDVEGTIGNRSILSRPVQQPKLDAGVTLILSSVVQLARRIVKSNAARTTPGQTDRPLGPTAPELQDVHSRNIAQDLQLILRNRPDAPRQRVSG